MELHEFSYLAGILDGEGHIAVQSAGPKRPGGKRQYRFTIDVKMTSEVIIDWLHQSFGGRKSFHRSKNPNWRDQWRWRITGKSARSLYLRVQPLLKIKNNVDLFPPHPKMTD